MKTHSSPSLPTGLRPPGTNRSGFTLIELLVVIAIIAILIGLLVPAVQKVRAAAARMSCQNNLKQLALASHNYHDQKGNLFPGYVAWNTPGDIGEATWVYFILPYIEQDPLFKTVDYNVIKLPGQGFGQGSNTTDMIRKTRIKTMSCPADLENPNVGTAYCPGGWAKGNYVANLGLGPAMLPTATGTTAVGVFYNNSKEKLTSITDGTSNTVFFSELLNVMPGSGEDWRGVMHYPEGPLYEHNYTPNSTTPDQIRFCNSTPEAPCTTTNPYWTGGAQVFTSARSQHPGGVNAAFGDGGVRFIQNGIALNVWQALATPRRITGEVIATDF